MIHLVLDESDAVNVARHRPARHSSTSEWSEVNESGRAVSGARPPAQAFHTAVEHFPWWMVELERPYPLDAVVIWNRDDDFAWRARSLRIQVSVDGERWQMVHRGRHYFRGSVTGRPLVHFLAGEVRARYVRISLEETVPLHLAQVEVYVSNNVFALEQFWRALAARNPRFPGYSPETSETRYTAVKGSAPGSDLAVTALKLSPYGRFGNQFHQLLNATVLAKHWGIPTVILPRGFPFGDLPRAEPGMPYVYDGEDRAPRALSGYFYFVDLFQVFFEQITVDDLIDTLDRWVRPLYRRLLERAVPAPRDTMHFHFRSGDVFTAATPHGSYVQPPVAFYRAALEHAAAHFGIQRAVVVYEDRHNPAVDAFIEHLTSTGIEHRTCSASLEDDVVELLGARILCQSVGTFTEAVLCLSAHTEVAYGFRGIESFPGINKVRGGGIPEILTKRGLALQVIQDTAPGYPARGSWINSREQREIMLAYPVGALQITQGHAGGSPTPMTRPRGVV